MRESVVVKIGGSLYDWPDLGPRLCEWLALRPEPGLLLVPGGGPAADVIRDLDRRHGLGEERAHWLALRALSLNAYFLADLLPGSRLLERAPDALQPGCWILDAERFLHDEENRAGKPFGPHSWDFTSDSVALLVADRLGIDRLILLKSVDVPADLDWNRASQMGLVDPLFAQLKPSTLRVEALNLRTWKPASA